MVLAHGSSPTARRLLHQVVESARLSLRRIPPYFILLGAPIAKRCLLVTDRWLNDIPLVAQKKIHTFHRDGGSLTLTAQHASPKNNRHASQTWNTNFLCLQVSEDNVPHRATNVDDGTATATVTKVVPIGTRVQVALGADTFWCDVRDLDPVSSTANSDRHCWDMEFPSLPDGSKARAVCGEVLLHYLYQTFYRWKLDHTWRKSSRLLERCSACSVSASWLQHLFRPRAV